MSQKEQKKWEEMICLTTDHEVEEMLRTLEYNWDTAASRMEQITHDRQLGLYDDSGVEAMAVFNRMGSLPCIHVRKPCYSVVSAVC